MLKGFPRCIVGMVPSKDDGQVVMIPPGVDWGSKSQVSRYAIVEHRIVGRIDPRAGIPPNLSDPETPASTYFVLNTRAQTVEYFPTRQKWCNACSVLGIDCTSLVWEDPNPRPDPPTK